MSKNRRVLSGILLGVVVAWPAFGEDGWVRRAAALRSDASAAGNVVAKVVQGDRVNILEKSGAWDRVDFKGQVGWLSGDSISSREIRPETRLPGMSANAESTSGAAAKGLQDTTINYAKGRHVSTAGVSEMEDIRKSINSQMLKDFVAEGNIAPPRKRRAAPAAEVVPRGEAGNDGVTRKDVQAPGAQ